MRYLQEICSNSVQKKELSLVGTKNTYLNSSPSNMLEKVTKSASEKHKCDKKLHYYRKSIKSHLKKQGRSFNFNEDLLFPPNLKELGEKYFEDKKVSQGHIGRHLFAESLENIKIGRISGNRCRRFSPLFIRYVLVCLKKIF